MSPRARTGGHHHARTLRPELTGEIRTALDDLRANSAGPGAQGPTGYARQMIIDHPGSRETELRADAVLAVETFYSALLS